MQVEKNDAIKIRRGLQASELSFERQHQKKPNIYQWATVPCSYWFRLTQLNAVGLVLIGFARLSRSHF
jgi:hypothetical protein